MVLLRDGAIGLEVFLLRRVRAMAFAAGMSVFPGGSVDDSDRVRPEWRGPEPAAWTEALSADEDLAAALICAAVRETYEETGVLLADSDPAVSDGDRQALERHELSLAELLSRHELSLRADLLRPWAHWITPEGEPRRYDTRFFLAALPGGQQARGTTSEAEVTEWVRPADALAQHAAESRPMLPPTLVTLRELATIPDVATAWAQAADRKIEPILPRLRGSGVVLPGGEAVPFQ